ncbi:lipase-like domain-containing protein [Staphylococcus epidermidis]
MDYGEGVWKSKIWNSEDEGVNDVRREGGEKINQQRSVNGNIV